MQVAEATEQRKEENADATETLASNNAAKEIMGMAKNRMNKFYNPLTGRPIAVLEEHAMIGGFSKLDLTITLSQTYVDIVLYTSYI